MFGIESDNLLHGFNGSIFFIQFVIDNTQAKVVAGIIRL